MDVLIPYTLADFDLRKRPGPSNPGGGVAAKYARCEEIPGELNFRRITTIPEVNSDIVFADWLWFSPAFMGEEDVDRDARIDEFLNLDVQFKGISGTELHPVLWSEAQRRKIIEGVDCITHVNNFQKSIYKYCGITTSKLLCDPINEFLFYPGMPKGNRLVCMGQIGEHKRTHLVIRLFEALKDTDITTLYIGSANMWGDPSNVKRNKLQEHLEDVADEFIENATEIETAYALNNSRYYAHVAWHDTSPISQRENMLSGNITFALTHPSMQEVTPYCYLTLQQMIEGIKEYNENRNDQLKSDAEKAWKFAMKHNSYKAWRRQICKIFNKELVV